MVLSNFTWAFFEDSGWYSINYAYTNSIESLQMKWGKGICMKYHIHLFLAYMSIPLLSLISCPGLGCDFVTKPCTDTAAFPYSCVSHGCTFDRISKVSEAILYQMHYNDLLYCILCGCHGDTNIGHM